MPLDKPKSSKRYSNIKSRRSTFQTEDVFTPSTLFAPPVSDFPSLKTPNKKVKLIAIQPSDFVNQRYTKQVGVMVDQYNAQNTHIKNLIDIKQSIKHLKSSERKRNSPTCSLLSKKYILDNKSQQDRANLYKSKYVNNTFRLNEEMTRVFKDNISLQAKINHIQMKGAGNIPTPRQDQQIRSVSTKRNFVGKNEMSLIMSRQKPSLNYHSKVREAQRIDTENCNLAKRVVNLHGSIQKKSFDRDFMEHIKFHDRMENA